jgi:hypothetical protein
LFSLYLFRIICLMLGNRLLVRVARSLWPCRTRCAYGIGTPPSVTRLLTMCASLLSLDLSVTST